MLRFGKVSVSNNVKGTVRVIVPAKNNQVSDDLPVLANVLDWPVVGDMVVCLFADQDIRVGVCLGKHYCDSYPYKETVNINQKLSSDKDVDIVGKVTIDGDVASKNISADGNISATGSMLDIAGNSNHHTH